jgi:dephospho-CoA kinase
MLFVGLTGGIGSGKSTVARMLAERGAVVLDADGYAREAAVPGTPQFKATVALFGPHVLMPGGELDRAAIAEIVFKDPARLRALEAIYHPEVRRRIDEERARHEGTDDVLVLDSPLLIEMGTHEFCDVVVVVTASPETRIARLVARGMDEPDARARLAVQSPVETMAKFADHLLDNEVTPEELKIEVDRLWVALLARRDASHAGG